MFRVMVCPNCETQRKIQAQGKRNALRKVLA